MPLHVLDSNIWFPPVADALEDGLLAIGGDLSTERILLAYRQGIFPWYDGDIPLWWCPNPRFVLYPQELIVSKSMRPLFNQKKFVFTTNFAFTQVMQNCMKINREGQDGSWINNDVIAAYTALHKMGYAHSAEVWQNGELIGGLYGIKTGKIFFGESMFSLATNASKYAFISYVRQLITEGIVLVDCQVYTPHLESLGARMIDRGNFIDILKANIS